MPGEDETFGSRLYAELKKLHASHLLSADYAIIQRLKQADREATVKLFSGSSYETIQRAKQDEPAELARYLVAQAQSASGAAATIFFMTMG